MKAETQGLVKDIATENTDLIEGFKKESQERAGAWKDFLGIVQSGKGIKPARVEPARVEEVKPAEKELAEKIAEEAEIPEEEKEAFRDQILDVLEDNPDGLKMTEIAEVLGIANWRSLIPVTRQLVEEGEIRKENSTYYIV